MFNDMMCYFVEVVCFLLMDLNKGCESFVL